MPKTLIYIGILMLLTACSGNGDKGLLLASVGDEELYQSDLNYLFAKDRYSFDDSVELVRVYTEQWVEEQIFVMKAAESDQIDHETIDQRVEKFRNDLIIYELENALLAERLDTTVTDEQIRSYYKSNEKEFQLNDYLVKVLYIKIPFDAPDVEKIAQSYKLTKPTDLASIQEYAKIYASNFYYDAENWIYFDDILKEVPLHDINKDKFILKKSKTRFEEGGFYYFLNIIDYKLKNTISPLNFEKQNIKDRILNIRVSKLREEIKNEIITNAYATDEVKIY
ncbi:MAG: hypothetical protein IPH24_11535 [Crocinitomicaceae bacterium]|nr:hypothetical protein [Crocinitomicaceae bacterium]